MKVQQEPHSSRLDALAERNRVREIGVAALLVVAIRGFRIHEHAQANVIEAVRLQQLEDVTLGPVTIGCAASLSSLHPGDVCADHEAIEWSGRASATSAVA